MGLIKAGVGAIGGVLADQWKEFFYCDSMNKHVLVTKGQKRVKGRSSNTRGDNNIISNGSRIAVADGQCMMIVEQGKVVEICADPGEFIYDASTESSIFTGDLGQSISDTFRAVGKRFTYGGDTGKDQRVYYFNTKELMDNKFGTPNPVPFRIMDSQIGLDMDVSVRCSGVYSYRIENPLLFYINVCGNVERVYMRQELELQLKTEFISALAPAFGKISALGIRPNQLPNHHEDIEEAMRQVLSDRWGELRGLRLISVAFNPVLLSEEDSKAIKQIQRVAVMRNPTMAAATLVEAQADAMKTAAANQGGAINGFLGMGMAMNQGGINAQSLYAMGQQKDGWKCSCGNTAEGNFCEVCGVAKPVQTGWKCQCGAVNQGRFCSECGVKKPADEPLYRCDKCGWQPENPKDPPKFCPECGDRFTEDDVQ